MKQNDKWKLVEESHHPSGNKSHEKWKDSNGNRIEKHWHENGELRSICCLDKNKNGWAKYFDSSGEIWFEIWRNIKRVSEFLIGNRRNNETE